MLRALTASALIFAAFSFSASAQETTELLQKSAPAFICTAQTEGQLTCQANKQCKCGYKPGDAGSGLPARWVWDCGIMRPRCEVTPADTSGEGVYPLPPVIIDHREDDHGNQ
ncbi:MAG: hypothetical protein IID51_02200 [Proteobacteria bacterium]|nr:hypothetical protein [Pseudomonadota bacterium]